MHTASIFVVTAFMISLSRCSDRRDVRRPEAIALPEKPSTKPTLGLPPRSVTTPKQSQNAPSLTNHRWGDSSGSPSPLEGSGKARRTRKIKVSCPSLTREATFSIDSSPEPCSDAVEREQRQKRIDRTETFPSATKPKERRAHQNKLRNSGANSRVAVPPRTEDTP